MTSDVVRRKRAHLRDGASDKLTRLSSTPSFFSQKRKKRKEKLPLHQHKPRLPTRSPSSARLWPLARSLFLSPPCGTQTQRIRAAFPHTTLSSSLPTCACTCCLIHPRACQHIHTHTHISTRTHIATTTRARRTTAPPAHARTHDHSKGRSSHPKSLRWHSSMRSAACLPSGTTPRRRDASAATANRLP